LHFHGKLNKILLLSGTSSPTAIEREVTASYQVNNGYAKAPQGNVESTLSVLITSLILHVGPNHRQANWSLAIL